MTITQVKITTKDKPISLPDKGETTIRKVGNNTYEIKTESTLQSIVYLSKE